MPISSDAPERIWAWRNTDPIGSSVGWNEIPGSCRQEYIRADLAPTGNTTLVETLRERDHWKNEAIRRWGRIVDLCEKLDALQPAAQQPSPEVEALVKHIEKMQSYVQEYLEPGPYVAKHGKRGTFYEPHQHQDEAHAYFMRQKMREAVLNDLIHMLDGPEERAALARGSVAEKGERGK